jgi:anti-sigma factor RsiW
MVENGSSGGARPLLPSESHDEFLELCALATTELLSAQERCRLEEHLRDCPTCREAFAQYQALVDTGIPAVGVERHADHVAKSGPGWSLDEAEAALFART